MGSKISSRIRELRKANGFKSAESLAEALDVSLKTVQGWENDNKESNITLQNLLKMCDLFHCDLDHLTGRIQEPTHEIKFIHERTGLSVGAIKKLMSLKDTGLDNILSDVFSHEGIDKLLRFTRIAIDEVEMWWCGLLELPLITDNLDYHKEVADFSVSKAFLEIVDALRQEKDEEEGFYMNREQNILRDMDYRQFLYEKLDEFDLDMWEGIKSEEDFIKAVTKDNDFSEHEARIMYKLSKEEHHEISYYEWKKMMSEIK